MDADRLLARRAACKATHHNGNGFGLTLGNAATLAEVGLWPTPRDHKDVGDPHSVGIRRNADRGLLGAQAVSRSETAGKLNPDFVLRLMGFPDGWLDLDS